MELDTVYPNLSQSSSLEIFERITTKWIPIDGDLAIPFSMSSTSQIWFGDFSFF
jgi:hypothetical protein